MKRETIIRICLVGVILGLLVVILYLYYNRQKSLIQSTESSQKDVFNFKELITVPKVDTVSTKTSDTLEIVKYQIILNRKGPGTIKFQLSNGKEFTDDGVDASQVTAFILLMDHKVKCIDGRFNITSLTSNSEK